ncbi:MAG: DUF4388 domain-containing protein, partial [Pleurocapsa sp. SU_196_0]|nr:DUF4388 domain-containing protein [Pleurocapsa sp. SU_196_0]
TVLSSSLENNPDCVLITDAELDLPGPRILYANPSFERMSGYRLADLLGQTPRLFQGPDTDRDMLRRLRKALDERRIFVAETTNYRRDGTPYRVRWQITPIFDATGAITHFVSVQRDVTARRDDGAQHSALESGASFPEVVRVLDFTVSGGSLLPGSSFRGRLEHVGGAGSLVQMLSVSNPSGALVLNGQIRLHLQGGRIVYLEHPRLTGIEAAVNAFQLESGTFEFTAIEHQPDAVLEINPVNVALEAARRNDEARHSGEWPAPDSSEGVLVVPTVAVAVTFASSVGIEHFRATLRHDPSLGTGAGRSHRTRFSGSSDAGRPQSSPTADRAVLMTNNVVKQRFVQWFVTPRFTTRSTQLNRDPPQRLKLHERRGTHERHREAGTVAIFGNLTEFPLVEVLAMLEGRTGILRFTQVGMHTTLDLHLENGQLRALVADAQPVKESFEARSYLMELVGRRQGEFSFERKRLQELRGDFSLSARSVVLQGAVYDSEIEQYRSYLPEPATVFTVAANTTGWLEDELKLFWERSQFLLSRHASAQDIASELRLDLSWVQLALYKLRVAGVIRPARRIADAPTPSPVARQPVVATTTNARPTLVSRLLGALGLIRRAS